MSPTPLGNKDLIRALNRSLVLNTIKRFGPIARAEVARRTGLSPATVTGLTADLIEEGLVFEKAAGDSSGGRPPILLALNPRGGYVVGVKLTESQVIAALTDLEATIVAKVNRPWGGESKEEIVQVISDVISTLVAQGNIRRKQLIGLGVGLAGVVDARAGILRKSPYLPWRDLPLRDLLQSRLRLPVYLDNDVNTLTLAEKWFGAGQGVENFLVVTVGRGIGLGIVMNGQFCRGAHGGAGEFGHTLVDAHGPLCACGKRGCLEAYASDPALMREASAEGTFDHKVSTPDELAALAAEGNASAQAILGRAGAVLGRAVADLINLLDPELIILGGEGTRFGEAMFGPMRQAMGQQVMSGLSNDIQIRLESWGDDAWARGAASLVLRELFESPVHKEEIPGAATVR